MALYNFHRVLIAATIFFDLAFSLYCFRKFQETGDWLQLAMLVGAVAILVGFVVYLILFNWKVTLLRNMMERREGEEKLNRGL